MVFEFDVYGTSKSGARHHLSSLICTTKDKAVNITKRDFKDYSNLSAQKVREITKSIFYKEMHNINQNWSEVSR